MMFPFQNYFDIGLDQRYHHENEVYIYIISSSTFGYLKKHKYGLFCHVIGVDYFQAGIYTKNYAEDEGEILRANLDDSIIYNDITVI